MNIFCYIMFKLRLLQTVKRHMISSIKLTAKTSRDMIYLYGFFYLISHFVTASPRGEAVISLPLEGAKHRNAAGGG